VVKEKWKDTQPLRISTEEAVRRAIELMKENERILILYLFGSRGRKGEASPDSDIDFAFLTDTSFTWDDYYALHGSMSKALGTDRFNLLWLNRADPIITFEVIATGKALYFKDPDTLNDFELKAKKNFYDYRYYLERHRRGL